MNSEIKELDVVDLKCLTVCLLRYIRLNFRKESVILATCHVCQTFAAEAAKEPATL